MDDWLKTTRKIQTDTYGRDPSTLEGPEQAEFVRWNVLAAHAELTEALEETRWKPWAVFEEGDDVVPDAQAFTSELVDVCMFVANLLVTAGVSDADFERVYHAKWAKNIERQSRVEGYQSRRGVDKCTVCARSFDDVGRYKDTAFCSKCGEGAHDE